MAGVRIETQAEFNENLVELLRLVLVVFSIAMKDEQSARYDSVRWELSDRVYDAEAFTRRENGESRQDEAALTSTFMAGMPQGVN